MTFVRRMWKVVKKKERLSGAHVVPGYGTCGGKEKRERSMIVKVVVVFKRARSMQTGPKRPPAWPISGCFGGEAKEDLKVTIEKLRDSNGPHSEMVTVETT